MQATLSAYRPFTHRLLLPLLAAAALVGGCSTLDIPYPESHPATGQKKARAIHHWNVLADDVAQRIAEKISDWPVGEYPIYIPPASDASGFNQGFRKLLITRLVERGITLSTQPTAVELAFDAQIVQYRTNRPLTRLGYGVAVARDWNMYSQESSVIVVSDNMAFGEPVRAEVLVTTSLESGQRYLARTADVYYIDTDDVPLYTVGQPPPPTPIKTWRVVLP